MIPDVILATIACSNAKVKVLGRPRKKLGYVYLDLYRRPWGHTNRDGLLAIHGHFTTCQLMDLQQTIKNVVYGFREIQVG